MPHDRPFGGAPSPEASPTSWIQLHTERMTLVRPTPGDLEALCTMDQDPRTMEMLLGVRGRDQTAAMLDRVMAHWDTHGFGWWMVRDRETGAFLGRGGLRRVEFAGQSEVEVSYGFHAHHWGKGLATELARASIRLGFEELGASSILSFTLPQNAASRRVMEKCGLVYQGREMWSGIEHVFYRVRLP